MRTTPDDITVLAPNEIFVFGSNLAGRHGRGAALRALRFGARQGEGHGWTGRCYALPTLDANLQKLTHADLKAYTGIFIEEAYENLKWDSDEVLLLTKVGCGLAGYDESYMKQFFKNTPPNVIKPEGW